MTEHRAETKTTPFLAKNRHIYSIKGKEWGVVVNDGASGALVMDFDQYLEQQTQFQAIVDPVPLMDEFRANEKVINYLSLVLSPTGGDEGYTMDRLEKTLYMMVENLTNSLQMNMFIDQHSAEAVSRELERQSLPAFITQWKLKRFAAGGLNIYRRKVTLSECEAAVNRATPQNTQVFDAFKKISHDWKKQSDSILNEAVEEFSTQNRETRGKFSNFATRWWAKRRSLLQIKELELVARDKRVSGFIHQYLK